MADIKVNRADKDFARNIAAQYQSEFDRKRVFKSLICAEAMAKILLEEGLSIEGLGDFCKNIELTGKYEFTDLFCNSYFLDVRGIVDGRYVLIPKIQYNEGILPDIYVAANYYPSTDNVSILGFIESSKVPKTKEDDKYYIVDVLEIKPFAVLKNFLKETKTISVNDTNHDKYGYLPSELVLENESTRKEVILHLTECRKCRKNLSELYDFEKNMKAFSNYPDIFDNAKPAEDAVLITEEKPEEQPPDENDPLQILYGNTNSDEIFSMFDSPQTFTNAEELLKNAKDLASDLPEGMTEKAFEKEREENEFDFDTEFTLPESIYIPQANYSFEDEENLPTLEDYSIVEDDNDDEIAEIPEGIIFNDDKILPAIKADEEEFSDELPAKQPEESPEETATPDISDELRDENSSTEEDLPEDIENHDDIPETPENEPVQCEVENEPGENESGETPNEPEVENVEDLPGETDENSQSPDNDLTFDFEKPVISNDGEDDDSDKDTLIFPDLSRQPDVDDDALPVVVDKEVNEDNMLSFEIAAKKHVCAHDYYEPSDEPSDEIVYIKPGSSENSESEIQNDLSEKSSVLPVVEDIEMKKNDDTPEEFNSKEFDFVRPASFTDFSKEEIEDLPESDKNPEVEKLFGESNGKFDLEENPAISAEEPEIPELPEITFEDNSEKDEFENQNTPQEQDSPDDYEDIPSENSEQQNVFEFENENPSPEAKSFDEVPAENPVVESGIPFEENSSNEDEYTENAENEVEIPENFENTPEYTDEQNFESEDEELKELSEDETDTEQNDIPKKIPGSFFNDMSEFKELDDDDIDDAEYESFAGQEFLKKFIIFIIILTAIVSGILVTKKLKTTNVNTASDVKTSKEISLQDYGETGNIQQPEVKPVSIKAIKWEVPEGFTAADKQYLKDLGKEVLNEVTSKSGNLNINVVPDTIFVNINFTQDLKLKSVKIGTSSGNKKLDDIVLQSVNKAGSTVKPPESVYFDNNKTGNKKTVLMIGF